MDNRGGRLPRFSAPVVYTTVGWVKIEADNLFEAQLKAKEINEEDGIEHLSIQDPISTSLIDRMEIEEIK